MILTVTLNTALDKVIFIDEWTSGLPMRTSKILTCVGGKGLDSSVVLRHLGVETAGLCFVAEESGKELLRTTEEYGIRPIPVWVGGETRLAHVIIEKRHHRHSHIISGALSITDGHCRQMLELFSKWVKGADYVICAGSIPAGVPTDLYARMTVIAHQNGIPLLIDSQLAAICDSLPARPDIVKLNWDEFERTFQIQAANLPALVESGTRVYQQYGIRALVLTCAADGILAFTPDGAFHAIAPRQQAVNAAGAGDAVSSALAWRLSQGDAWPEALCFAAATSAAVVLTERTADCHMEDIVKILPAVKIEAIRG
jgi:1-phosphofructokinase family hexose kinase